MSGNHTKEGLGVLLEGRAGKFSLLILKYVTKRQISKWSTFVLKSQLRFCQWEDPVLPPQGAGPGAGTPGQRGPVGMCLLRAHFQRQTGD